jgi:hypothetical protein
MELPDDSPTHPGPSWHAEPLGANGRLRWWDGRQWTAWVAESAIDPAAIAWHADLAELPPPIHWGTATLRVAVAPPLTIRSIEDPTAFTPPAVDAPAAPMPAPVPALAAGEPSAAEAQLRAAVAAAAPAIVAEPKRRKRRRHLVLVAALLPLLIAGAASAALLTPNPPRPVLTSSVVYRDATGGFSLAYPRSWRIERANAGQGIQFLVGPARVAPDKLTMVAVLVGTVRGPLPAVADLTRTATDGLRADLPGVRFVGSSATYLAGHSAIQLQFTDPDTAPPTTVQQVTGRTADDRPLTVWITVHDPSVAPSASDVHDFLTSIAS